MITFENALFEAQFQIFFILLRSHILFLRYSIFHTQLKAAYQLPKLWYHDVYLHSKSFQIDAQLVFTTTLSSIHTLFTFLYEHIHKLSSFLVLLIHIQHFFQYLSAYYFRHILCHAAFHGFSTVVPFYGCWF